MAPLPPDGEWLMQQIGGSVVMFHRYADNEIVRFDPLSADATAKAQRVIHDSAELTDEQKSFAHFWAGYFYAHSSPGEARIDAALKLILKHAEADSARHKQWVLAQVAELLSAGSLALEDKGTAP